jgi:hypothetical protein
MFFRGMTRRMPSDTKPLPPGVTSVVEGLYIGSDAAVGAMVKAHGCRVIVSCLEELSDQDRLYADSGGIRVVHVPMADSAEQRLGAEIVASATDVIDGYLQEWYGGEAASLEEDEDADAVPDAVDSQPTSSNKPEQAEPCANEEPPAEKPCIYVHCHAGTSRSVAVAIAYLMLVREMRLRDAVDALTASNAAARIAPNPSFIGQLIGLDEQIFGAPTTFDARAFFVKHLCQLFPTSPAEEVGETLDAVHGNVYAARDRLMRHHASAFVNRDQIMIDCIHRAVANQGISRSLVHRIYNEEGKHRDRALARLFKLTPENLVDLLLDSDYTDG